MFEYIVRSIPVSGPGPTVVEKKINDRIQTDLETMSAHGWRLVSTTTAMTMAVGAGGTSWLRMIWERESATGNEPAPKDRVITA